MEENKSVYYLKKTGNINAFCAAVKNIKGVLAAEVDQENMVFTYFIDEWASDYDVFTEVMSLAEAYSFEFDFDRTEEDALDNSDEGSFNAAGGDEYEDSADNSKDIKKNKKEYEYREEDGEKRKKKLSENMQRLIELAIAAVFFVAGLFFNDQLQYILLALSFAVAGYEVLYEAAANIFKKRIFTEQLLLSLAFFVAVFTGYVTDAVAAVFLYSVADFLLKAVEEIKQKRAVSFTYPEKCRKFEDQTKSLLVEPEQIVAGDKIVYNAGEYCLFDGICVNAAQVVGFNGNNREVAANGEIFAGEKFAVDAVVCVSCAKGENKFEKRNDKFNEIISSKGKVDNFVTQKRPFIVIAFLAACLLIAFIPPIFSGSYAQALNRWAYRAVMVAMLGSFALLTGSHSFNIFSAVLACKQNGVVPCDYQSAHKVAQAKQCFIDENVIYSNGIAKEDANGAVRELKDCPVMPVLVSSLSDDECAECCKQLKIPEYYPEKDNSGKEKVFSDALNEGNIVAVSGDFADVKANEKGSVVLYDGNQCNFADAAVRGGAVAHLPFVIKLAKRTVKFEKISNIICLGAKCVLAVLALLGIAQLWWLTLADVAVGAVSLVLAKANAGEVY